MNLSKRSVFLIVCDLVAIIAGFWGVAAWHYLPIETTYLDKPTFYLVCFVFLFLYYLFDLYYPYKLFSFRKGLLLDVLFATTLAALAVIGIGYWDRSFYLPRTDLLLSTVTTAALVCSSRYIYNALFRSRFFDRKTLVVGSPVSVQKVLGLVRSMGHTGIEPISWSCPEELFGGEEVLEGVSRATVGPDRMIAFLDEKDIRLVVFAFSPNDRRFESALLPVLLRDEVTVITSVQLIENLTGAIHYEECDSDEMLNLVTRLRRKPYLRVKRAVDIVASTAILLALSPFALLAMGLIAVTLGPTRVFFVQERAGKDGHLFKLIKLRSMRSDSKGGLQITRIGRWMRKYRIDEIPQLINVLKGDMSLIGPRPETNHFVELCEANIPYYRLIYTLKPGLTGWAQVHQNHVTSLNDYQQKLRYNLFYIKNLSLKVDMEILFKTIRIVLRGMGK